MISQFYCLVVSVEVRAYFCSLQGVAEGDSKADEGGGGGGHLKASLGE